LFGYEQCFVDLATAMTEKELDEIAMDRVSWLKCLIPIWCITEAIIENTEQEKQKAAEAAAAAELQNYISQCEFKYN
jgi:hypothetical protein